MEGSSSWKELNRTRIGCKHADIVQYCRHSQTDQLFNRTYLRRFSLALSTLNKWNSIDLLFTNYIKDIKRIHNSSLTYTLYSHNVISHSTLFDCLSIFYGSLRSARFLFTVSVSVCSHLLSLSRLRSIKIDWATCFSSLQNGSRFLLSSFSVPKHGKCFTSSSSYSSCLYSVLSSLICQRHR